MIQRWHDKTLQFETPMCVNHFELKTTDAHLDFAQNQEYKFGRALSKSDLKIRPKLSTVYSPTVREDAQELNP